VPLRYLIISAIIFLCIVSGAWIIQEDASPGSSKKVIEYFTKGSVTFYNSTIDLRRAVQLMDSSDKPTIEKVKTELKNCRLEYKRISFFLDYFFPHQARIYNAPPKYEVEEPFMEYEEPEGLQLIESLLFEKHPVRSKIQLSDQAKIINESAGDLKSLLYQFTCSDAQVMESIRIELIRIMTLYITGYDAPDLKSGLAESKESLSALYNIVALYTKKEDAKDQKLLAVFQRAINFLAINKDFNSFDRLNFLSAYAIPLERRLGEFIEKKGLAISSVNNLDYQKRDLFSGEIIFSKEKPGDRMIALGKKLFYETRLSGNSLRSCATCHQPDKYYTDGLSKNKTADSGSFLNRNTPTLLYTSFQSAQFWDGRAKNLYDQVGIVLTNHHEMNADPPDIEKRLNRDSMYKSLFANAFAGSFENDIKYNQVINALVAFLQTLAPMNSAFDRYMHGDIHAMNPEQQLGFNLFAGKAQCATCHFIPLFNGLTPPFFNRSEFEVLGLPASDDFILSKKDADSGRFSFFPSPFFKSAFKTPTLRNVSKTAPYMHNGNFSSLEKVMEFYNRGGGAGLGLKISNQTLSEKPLHLTKKEIKAIILFLSALTDKISS
jgi:cytochrome c peroxidase